MSSERAPECAKCGGVECLCPVCHRACGLDHSPTLPPGEFPTTARCNPHCPGEAFLPYLVGLPGMKGASMALPIAALRQWSERIWHGGARLVEAPTIYYHPPIAGEINPMFAAGEWKDTPPDPGAESPIDIERLSTAMQSELARQLDAKRGPAEPEAPPRQRARVGSITRFDPNEHTVAEVLAHLRTATDAEVARVVAIERETSKRAGILKRHKEV